MKHLEIALREYGVKGITGILHSNTILKYFKDIGHGWVKDDETAWCAAFLNWVLLKAGHQHTGSLAARSFLNYGTLTKTPALGDIVVLWRIRKDSPFGHVGIYISETKNDIYILGGNQDNMVNITAFPKSRVLAYRTLSTKKRA